MDYSNYPYPWAAIQKYLTLVTAPATYPVTLAELKNHLAIDVDTDDARLTSLISAATDLCETYTGRAFVTQTWKLNLSRFPWCPFERFWLPKSPLQSVTSVKYYDSVTNTQTTWSNTNYYTVSPSKAQGFIEPVQGQYYPATYIRPDAVEIIFVCGGYGLPQVSQAIKLICAQWNEAREGDADIPLSAQRLLAQLATGAYQ